MWFTLKMMLLLLMCIAVPVLLVVLCVRFWRSERAFVRWLALAPVAVLVGLTALVYNALFPDEEFYRAEWTRSVGMPLPTSAVFEGKSATYPDIHGDYSAIAVVKCESQEVTTILDQLKSRGFRADTTGLTIVGHVQGFERVVRGFDLRQPFAVLVPSIGPWFRVSILNDRRTIVFERHSS